MYAFYFSVFKSDDSNTSEEDSSDSDSDGPAPTKMPKLTPLPSTSGLDTKIKASRAFTDGMSPLQRSLRKFSQ